MNIDAQKLEHAVNMLGEAPPWGVPKEVWSPVYAAAKAHLASLPRSVTVKRWLTLDRSTPRLVSYYAWETRDGALNWVDGDASRVVELTGEYEETRP